MVVSYLRVLEPPRKVFAMQRQQFLNGDIAKYYSSFILLQFISSRRFSKETYRRGMSEARMRRQRKSIDVTVSVASIIL